MSLVSTMPAPVATEEIKLPFRVNPSTGQIDYMTDPVQKAIQHIIMVLFTSPSERVMNPTYGVGIESMVFENSNLLEYQAAAALAQSQLQQTDGLFYDVQITVQQSPQQSGTFVFGVQFQVYTDQQVHTVIFDYAGNVIGES